MINIDKGVPIPDKKNESKYPHKQLEVMDSFFVEGYSTPLVCAIRNTCNKWGATQTPRR